MRSGIQMSATTESAMRGEDYPVDFFFLNLDDIETLQEKCSAEQVQEVRICFPSKICTHFASFHFLWLSFRPEKSCFLAEAHFFSIIFACVVGLPVVLVLS